MSSASIATSAGAAAQRQLHEGLKQVLAMFASGVVAVRGDKTLAGDELVPKNIDGFNRAMGVPSGEDDKNVLVTFAKVTAGASAGESQEAMAAYAQHPGVTTGSLEACQDLKNLCETGLASLSKTQRKLLLRRQKRVVLRITRLLHKDHAALKFVQTLAGLGFFATAAWLQWTADEKAWKIGSWAVSCIGAIRLLGNLMYNDAGAIHQGGKILYVHLGLGSVAYTMEILRRCGVAIQTNNHTMIASVLANLIPILGFYMRNIETSVEDGVYTFERWRTGGASSADVALLEPILDKFRSFTRASEDALADGSVNKPGNRASATGKEAENETRGLADLLALDVEPGSTTWKQFFLSLLHEAVVKSPSLIYALVTGVVLVAAAIGNIKALADNVIVLGIVLVEIGLGIKNANVTPEQMQYRLLLLILSRFGSVFFFAVQMIHDYRLTGRRDIYDRNPQFAATMAHCNAAFVCVLGLAVIPAIGLVDRVLKAAVKRAARAFLSTLATSNEERAEQDDANPADELDDGGRLVTNGARPLLHENDDLSFETLSDGEEEEEEDGDNLPPPDLLWEQEGDDDEEDAAAEEELDKISKEIVLPIVEEMSRKFKGDGGLPVSMMQQLEDLAHLAGSNQIDPCSW